MDRTIVHMDLDTFFVSCERLLHSELKGMPLIIGGHSDRGVVASCSYEARYFGVRSAMPIKMALQLCPQAKVLRGDMELYSNQSKIVTSILQEESPLLEKASIDEFYIDITGLDRFFGCYKWTNELVHRITKETGLPISFGLSINKTVAKMATSESKPEGRFEVLEKAVKPFLFPLPINKIPMLGQSTANVLSRIGVRKIQTLAEMPVEVIVQLLGKNGQSLWKKANGIDLTPVEPFSERKSISTETTFEKDTIDIQHINDLLVSMVEKLAFQLRQEQKVAACIAIKIRYSNFDTHTQQCKIPYSASDHVLIGKAKELFSKLYSRRMLIRLIGVRLSDLVHGYHQINLFEDTHEMIALYNAMDKIRNKFGKKAIGRAGGHHYKK